LVEKGGLKAEDSRKKGGTPLHWAAASGQENVIELLVETIQQH
jgi:hypothetical protein